MATENYGAIVIGSGPGGYVCGIRLGHLGIKTLVIEKESPGGVCLNVGCIPSKALIHAAKTYEKIGKADELGISVGKPTVDMKKMQAWKGGIVNKLTTGVKGLLKANSTDFTVGTAKILGRGADGIKVEISGGGKAGEAARTVVAKSIVLATGSRPIEIPGFELDDKFIIDSSGALALDAVPERLVVVGGGYIGLELGTVYAKLGSKITVVEMQDGILSGMDKDCTSQVAKKLKKMGVEVQLGAKAKGWEEKSGRAVMTIETKNGEAKLDADKILVSVGRRANIENLGLEEAGVKTERGFVVVDSQQRTNIPGIYAIGDVAGGMLLAHKASKEAEVVAEVIAGHKGAMDARCIPAVVFTDPEVASAGLTEDEAKQAGHSQLKVGKFPFAALGRALSVNDTDGFAKVVADAKTDEVLGVHIVGNGASDLISEAALAIEMGAVLHDLSLTIHPHPTLSEAIMEAAGAALGEAVHVINR